MIRLIIAVFTYLLGTINVNASSNGDPVKDKQNDKRPNVIIFFADDLGSGDVQCYNPVSKIKTPNIDKLASQGVRFTDAHTVGSLCAPSRFGLMTGRNPAIWTNYTDIESEAWNCLMMPEMFQQQGYATACIGKWHFGVLFEGKDGRWGAPSPVGKRFPAPADNWKLTAPTKSGPVDRGFDYFFGTPLQPGGGWHANMEGNTLLGNPKLKPNLPATKDFDNQKWMKVILGKTKEKIDELSAGDKPFFLYFPINSPHKPIIPDEEFIGKSGIGKYGDYCQQVDWCVGEVMEAIDKAGIAHNTILIFTSDNGSFYYPGSVNGNEDDEQELRGNKHRANSIYKKGKGQPEEGGHRVPYIVRWPGQIEAGTVNNTTISLGDHFATFAELTGYELKPEDAIDSWNILPIIKGEQPTENYSQRVFFHFNNNPRVDAVRMGQWKMIPACYYKEKKPNKGRKGKLSPEEKKKMRTFVPGQLYDLSQDPGELNNLWEQHPEIVERLSIELKKYKKRKHNASHIE
ncbi:sulfatase family protein [Carboxylicivirga sp. RSCT41]|uniref:sulfatase family protein n=1 Tax=Carboxylicivirga agarovorans TaxID=3417570 RepID=UPI003D33659D